MFWCYYTILSRNGEGRHPCLALDSRGKEFNVLLLGLMLPEGFFTHVPLTSDFLCIFFNHEEVFVYSLTACISLSLDFRSLIMMCLGVVVFILLDLSSIYHIFLKFLLAFISLPWNSSCGVHNVVLNKPFSTSLASFLSLYAGCSSFSHLLNVDIPPPFSFYFICFPWVISFTPINFIYHLHVYNSQVYLSRTHYLLAIVPPWCSTGTSFLICLKLN